MQSFIEPYIPQIRALCKKMGVKELSLVGSAARGADFTDESDVDFLYELVLDQRGNLTTDFDAVDFLLALQDLTGRKVDLVHLPTISNPYFQKSVQEDKKLVYEA